MSKLGKGYIYLSGFWICRVTGAGSAEAERCFSALEHLVSKLRNRLSIHLPACLRLALSESLGNFSSVQLYDTGFVREIGV